MRVGIATWFYGDNYGARAHSLALYEVIKDLGHECFFINYKPRKIGLMNCVMNLNVDHWKVHPFLTYKCLLRCHRFNLLKNNYPCTKRCFSIEDVNKLDLDTIIFGSDEIWKTDHPFTSDFYFGVGIQTNKMTYAVSSGQTDVNESLSNERKKSLLEMKAISVRDEHTQQLVFNNTGIKPEIVLDPTLIWQLRKYYEEINIHSKYLLIYSFSSWDEYEKEIKEFARAHNVKVISLGRYSQWVDKSYDAVSFGQWLWAFANAEYVITDSFHGAIFSVINQKEFVLLGRFDKRNKIYDLMKELKVDRSFYDGEESIENYIASQPINYEVINERINTLRDNSILYLKKNIALE